MLDSHCHLNLDPLVDNIDQIVSQAKQAGITTILIPGVNQESSLKAVEIASTDANLYAAIGLHPHEAEQALTTQTTNQILAWLRQLASQPQVVAIGECGLDYFRLADDPLEQKHAKAAQKKLFKLHIKVSQELNKPLLVHVRDAQADAIDLLEKFKPKAVLHCFSGDKDYLDRALAIGCYISFAGNITFANAKELQQLIHQVPLDRLLLETDSPYLNPTRGVWPNTPSQISKTYQVVAELLEVSVDDLANQIKTNFTQLIKSAI